jgi:hypothetical protein
MGQTPVSARARVLNARREPALYRAVRAGSQRKYGWRDGLPVELTPELRLA